MAFADQAGKQAVDELVAQLPQLETFIAKQLTNIQNTLELTASNTLSEFTKTIGEALAAVTAERQELVNDIHGILDRLQLAVQILPRRS